MYEGQSGVFKNWTIYSRDYEPAPSFTFLSTEGRPLAHSDKLIDETEFRQRANYYGLRDAFLVANDLVWISKILTGKFCRLIGYNRDGFHDACLVNQVATATVREPEELYYSLVAASEKVSKCGQ